MNAKDLVHISDAGYVHTSTGVERRWGDEGSVVEVHGWVEVIARERGKRVPGSCRGCNVWTNTGREFVAQRISLDPMVPSSTIRTDAVAYIGVGTGSQLEEPGVLHLVTPIIYDQDLFLADISSVSFPLYPSRTTVEYRRTFAEREITTADQAVLVSEFGLFTNGDPNAAPANGFNTRSRSFAASATAAPIAYKNFDPISKTPQMQLEVAWQIRF
jgi:hypothetical protein